MKIENDKVIREYIEENMDEVSQFAEKNIVEEKTGLIAGGEAQVCVDFSSILTDYEFEDDEDATAGGFIRMDGSGSVGFNFDLGKLEEKYSLFIQAVVFFAGTAALDALHTMETEDLTEKILKGGGIA